MAHEKQTSETMDAGLQKASPKGVFKGSREEWLTLAMIIMGAWLNEALQTTMKPHRWIKNKVITLATWYSTKAQSFDGQKVTGSRLPKPSFKHREVRVSCSLQDSGMTNSNALAHVHLKHATGNNKHEIRIGVHVGGKKTKEQSLRVADVLLHELIHTVFPEDGHRGGFYHLAKAVGLNGPMTSTTASEALKQRIKREVVDVLGKYPHEEVKLNPRGKRGKGSRLILCRCPECGCKLRLSRMWIKYASMEGQGHVSCPMGCDGEMDI